LNTKISQDVTCLIIGAGEMGLSHLDVVRELLPNKCAVFSRSTKNKTAVESKGGKFFSGDLKKAISEFSPSHVIIAVPVEKLSSLSKQVLSLGIKNILIEKPAVLTVSDGLEIIDNADREKAHLWVGYNRRFYSSVRTALRMIRQSEESINSIFFEFTEWSHIIEGLKNQSQKALENWVLSNSMHVIDAALHPVGMPNQKKAIFNTQGSLLWHPSACIFSGAGVTLNDVQYSYNANWAAPGRWSFEWLTPSVRYIFRPMEKLHITKKGSVAINEVKLDDDLDIKFKPGVFMQNQQFFLGNPMGLMVPLSEAVELVRLSQLIGNYPLK